jgi:hypothetical protein
MGFGNGHIPTDLPARLTLGMLRGQPRPGRASGTERSEETSHPAASGEDHVIITTDPQAIIVPTAAVSSASEVEQVLDEGVMGAVRLLERHHARLREIIQEKIEEAEENNRQEELLALRRLQQRVQERISQLIGSIRSRASNLSPEAAAALESRLQAALSSISAISDALDVENLSLETIQTIGTDLEELETELEDIANRMETLSDSEGLTTGQLSALANSRVYVGTRFCEMLEDMGLLGPNGLSEQELTEVLQMRQYFALLMGDAAPRTGRHRIPSSRTDQAFLRLVREARSQPGGGLTRAELQTITGVRHTRQAFSAFYIGRHGAGGEAADLNGLFEGIRGLVLTCIHRNNLPVTLESLQANPEQLAQHNTRFSQFYRQYATERRFYFIDSSFEADLGRQFAEALGLNPTAEEIAEEMERLGEEAAVEAEVRDNLLLRNFWAYLRQQGVNYSELREAVRVMERSGASTDEMWAATMIHVERIMRHNHSAVTRRDEESQERYDRRLDNAVRRFRNNLQNQDLGSPVVRGYMFELYRMISGRDERDGMPQTEVSDETRPLSTIDFDRVVHRSETFSADFRPARDPRVPFSPSAESESAGQTGESAGQDVVVPRVTISEVR